MAEPRLEVDIYQIAGDEAFQRGRGDGTGWEWGWADWQRDWMDATPNRHAYRCLPLTIANQAGWWVRNPVGFVARWQGSAAPGSIDFRFDVAGDYWSSWINSQFGEGIITWNTPFLFRTRPEGSRLLICGPANYFKADAHPLMALIESDWMTMSFTMNWKLTTSERSIRFEPGEPLFQAIPLAGNVGADLETAAVRYQKLSDDPEMARAYQDWSRSRSDFQQAKAAGAIAPDRWQKDYFKGGGPARRDAPAGHRTKLKPPAIEYQGTTTMESESRGSLLMTANNGASTSVPGVRVDDEWRRWIAENLLVEAPPAGLVETMVGAGITRAEAILEVDLASKSPYLRGADLLRNRLKKRDWLAATHRKLRRLDPSSAEIPRLHRLPRDDFYRSFYVANRPVIITGMMDDWPALRKWSLDNFAVRFGGREVEIQFGRQSGNDYESAREKYVKKVPLALYVEMIRTAGVTNDFYLTANNTVGNRKTLPELWQDVVQIPEYLDTRDPMAGFFWMGPPGTITPYHHDLTNNFMAQVLGRKRVRMAPSWDLPLMQNDHHVFSRLDGRVTMPRPRPEPQEPQILECILEPGEILFLPIGWMHFVEGLDFTVTMSFTNFLLDNDFHSHYATF